MNPLPIAPTLSDVTDLTVAVSLAGRAETATPVRAPPPVASRNSYHARISAFIESLHLVRGNDGPGMARFRP